MKKSLSIRALDQRLPNVAGEDQTFAYRLRVTVANVVVGQLLPPGPVKGGRVEDPPGDTGRRFTPDLDTARRESLAQFIQAFEDDRASDRRAGSVGHAALQGDARLPRRGLAYGDAWYNEIGDADDPAYLLADDIAVVLQHAAFGVAVDNPDHRAGASYALVHVTRSEE